MQFQCHPVIPLGIGHFKQIDLRNSAGDIYQCINSSKSFQCLINEHLVGCRFAKVERQWQYLNANLINGFCHFFEGIAIASGKHERGEILGQSQGLERKSGSAEISDRYPTDANLASLVVSTSGQLGDGRIEDGSHKLR